MAALLWMGVKLAVVFMTPNPLIPAKAGIQFGKLPGFARLFCVTGSRIKSGMTG